MIDGPDMDAVGAHHRHMFPDRAMLGHGSSPRCQNHHTRRGGDSIHRRGETGRIVARRPPSTPGPAMAFPLPRQRSEEHTSELQSLMRISYAVFCLKKKTATLIPLTTTKTQTLYPSATKKTH